MLKIMIDTEAPASTRLRAADRVFSHAKHAIEMEQIEGRIAVLEQAVEQAKPPGKGSVANFDGRPDRVEGPCRSSLTILSKDASIQEK
jgi:ribosomal protein S7